MEDGIHNEFILWNDTLYKGEVKDGKRNGQGVGRFGLSFDEDNILIGYDAEWDGEWKDDDIQGVGIWTDVDEEYQGEMKGWKYHGHGVLNWRDGKEVYDGIFENGKFKRGKKNHQIGRW